MPTDPKKKKKPVKSSRSGLMNDEKKIRITTNPNQTKGDKDGRMQAARQAQLDKDVKKAGGSKKYLEKAAQGVKAKRDRDIARENAMSPAKRKKARSERLRKEALLKKRRDAKIAGAKERVAAREKKASTSAEGRNAVFSKVQKLAPKRKIKKK